MKSFLSSSGFVFEKKKAFCFCLSTALMFLIYLCSVHLGTATVSCLPGYLSFDPWPHYYHLLGRNVFHPGRNFSMFWFCNYFNHSGYGSGVDLQKWEHFHFSRTNCVFRSLLLFCVSLHVGILARWVHLRDNIHGYIPLSILVLAGRATVEGWLVGVSHRIDLRLHTNTHTHTRKTYGKKECWNLRSS